MKKRNKGRIARSGHALIVIALLLVASGIVRLGNGAGQAIAREAEALVQSSAPNGGAALEADTCATSTDVVGLTHALSAREKRVSEREAALDDLEHTLKLAKEELHVQLEDLEKAEAGLRATMALAEEAAETDLERLTAVYENMKPEDASVLFEEMAPEFAAGFLGRMRPESAAQVMTGLSPERAYTVSVILAGRNANAPTQ